jgi:hypothetical protein
MTLFGAAGASAAAAPETLAVKLMKTYCVPNLAREGPVSASVAKDGWKRIAGQKDGSERWSKEINKHRATIWVATDHNVNSGGLSNYTCIVVTDDAPRVVIQELAKFADVPPVESSSVINFAYLEMPDGSHRNVPKQQISDPRSLRPDQIKSLRIIMAGPSPANGVVVEFGAASIP